MGLKEASLSNNGWAKLPSGLIIQWCKGGVSVSEKAANPIQNVKFPIVFPNGCFSVIVSTIGDGTIYSDQIFQTVNHDKSSVNLFPQWFGTGKEGLIYPYIFAIGY